MPEGTWSIQGPHFVNCNCDYGCPCQFWGRPTDGTCPAVLAWRIDEGHYGDILKPIPLELDEEARIARLHVPGVLDTQLEPIKNKVTGGLHRARIALPFGKEFTLAEVASGSTRATGKVPLEFTNTHAHVVHNRLTAQGVAEDPRG